MPLPDEFESFDDDGTRVPAVGFDFESLDQSERTTGSDDDTLSVRQEAFWGLLMFLNCGRSQKSIGRRVILLSHFLRPLETQRALAKRLGVTPGRVSQELNVIKSEIDNFYKGFPTKGNQQN